MLHSIEIEIDANGCIHSSEPLPTGRRGILTLLDAQKPVSTTQNPFQNLFGMLKSNKNVSLEDMKQAISQKALERFNDCN